MCRLIREDWDIVVASRYYKGAKSEDDDVVTGFGNWLFTKAIDILFLSRLTDVLVGYRAYRRDAIEKMGFLDAPGETGSRRGYIYSWEPAASCRSARLRLKVLEIPGDEPKRIGGVRKLRVISCGMGAVIQILHDWLFFRRPG
jgi:hypothetical protein